MSANMQKRIESKLQSGFEVQYLNVLNESHNHSVPKNSETHFKVTLVSPDFDGVRSVRRHQQVYKLLAEELNQGVHALALHLYTPAEWRETGASPASPNCMGGSKHDKSIQDS